MLFAATKPDCFTSPPKLCSFILTIKTSADATNRRLAYLIASELKLSGCYALADSPVFSVVQIQISRHQAYESRISGVAQRSPLVDKKQTFRCVFRPGLELYNSFFQGVLAKPAQDRHGLKSQNVHKNVCQNFLSYAQKRRFCFESSL